MMSIKNLKFKKLIEVIRKRDQQLFKRKKMGALLFFAMINFSLIRIRMMKMER
jgi:hypothetical protein